MSEELAEFATALKRAGIKFKQATGKPEVYLEGDTLVVQADKPIRIVMREATVAGGGHRELQGGRVMFGVRYANDRRPLMAYWTCTNHGGGRLTLDIVSAVVAAMNAKPLLNAPPRNGSYGHEHPRHNQPVQQGGGRQSASHPRRAPRVNGHDVLRGQGGR